MSAERIERELTESRPEIILLANDSAPVSIQQLLDSNYRLAYFDSRHRLFVRKDTPKAAPK